MTDMLYHVKLTFRYALSVIVWHHVNATFAVRWSAASGYWREAHTNRVDVNPGRCVCEWVGGAH